MRVGENFCPGILHAVPAKDGMLIRIRVPGGLIDARQLKTVAALSAIFADGQVEITSRGNLQLRAIEECSLPEIVDGLTSVELLPSRRHDRVRNISTSPLAGLESEEFIDTRSLVRELDKRLIADDAFVDLHPKFSFGIYGGSRLFSHEQDDLALQAIRGSAFHGPPRFQLFLGGTDMCHAVSFDHAVDCLLEAARLCILLAKHDGLPVRGKRLVAVSGVVESVLEGVSAFLAPSLDPGTRNVVTLPAIGVHVSAQTCQRNIIPVIPLGRLSSKQAQRISESAVECEGDLRLAPWRGFVLGAVPVSRLARVVAQLDSVGLYLDGRTGFHGIAACAGVVGCDASLADVRSDAAMLAQRLAGRIHLPGWTVNLSGCEKQCAMRHGATAELVGTSSGYLLRINGQPAYEPLPTETAFSLILGAYKHFASEVAP